MSGVWIAEFDSPNYTFQGVGDTAEEAMTALRGATRVHALQASLPADWAEADLADVCPVAYIPRTMLRDGHEIKWPAND